MPKKPSRLGSPSPLPVRPSLWPNLVRLPPDQGIQPGHLSSRDCLAIMLQICAEFHSVHVSWQLHAGQIPGYPQYLFVVVIQYST